MTAEYVVRIILAYFMVSLFYLIIPMCIALIGKPMKRVYLWLIAIVGGLFGAVALAIMVGLRGNAPLIPVWVFFSLVFIPIGYLILSAKCSKNNKRELRVPLKRADKDIKNRLEEIEESGEDKSEYIKWLIREDIKRDQSD